MLFKRTTCKRIIFFLFQSGLKQIKFRSHPLSHFRSYSYSDSFPLFLSHFLSPLSVYLCLQGSLSSFSCSVSGPALFNVTLTVSLSVFNTCIFFSHMSCLFFLSLSWVRSHPLYHMSKLNNISIRVGLIF